MKERILILLAGCLLDLIVGDPHFLWHPVQGIGWLIEKTEKCIRSRLPDTAAGAVLAVVVVSVSTAVPAGLIALARLIHPVVAWIVEIVMCAQCLAMKSLKTESMKVYERLRNQDLPGARKAVSMIVGRDTERLDEAGVTRAAVETVAENASDGVIAPLLFLALFGVPGGFFYKSVNTMDSMIGYKNDKYRHFGTAAAHLDDIVNYLPSRISALFMIGGAFILPKPFSGKRAFHIWRRDRRKHASPNSAQTESVMAGALGVRLAGDAFYFGKLVKKPTIGDPVRIIEAEDIRRANRLLYVTSFLVLAACVAVMSCFLR